MGTSNYLINFSVQLHILHRGDDGLVAQMEPLGLVLRGLTMEDVSAQAEQAMDFFMSTFEQQSDPIGRLTEYFNSHDVDHTVTYRGVDKPADHSFRHERTLAHA